jgi:hypothetical protein
MVGCPREAVHYTQQSKGSTMKKIIAVIVLTLVMLTACESTSTTQHHASQHKPASVDAIYLKVIHQTIPQTKSVPDATLISTAKGVCRTFNSVPINDMTVSAFGDGFVNGGKGIFSYADAGSFLGASTAAYCPDVSERLSDYLTAG